MTTEREMTVQEAKRKRLDSLWWAVAIVLVGVVLLAETLDVLPEIGDEGEWWIWIFLALGVWSVLLNGFRMISPDLPNPRAWDYIWTVIFLGVGLGSAVELDIEGTAIAGVVLVVIGAILVLNLLRGQNQDAA